MTGPASPLSAEDVAADATPPSRARVSIAIPCYRQAERAARCLESVRAQSFTDFRVTVLDDEPGSGEYRRLVEALGDPRVTYRPNPRRLGGLGNIFQAVRLGGEPYSLAFHEDDLLGRHYLATAVGLLDGHPRCGFVAAELSEFGEEPAASILARAADPPAWEPLAS